MDKDRIAGAASSFAGKVEGCSLAAFQAATGLHLTDQDGSLREELPPITTFLNRLLALTIDLQNTLFGVFEDRHAVWRGLLDRGVLIRETGPPGWLRVSIGRPEEMNEFLDALREVVRR